MGVKPDSPSGQERHNDAGDHGHGKHAGVRVGSKVTTDSIILLDSFDGQLVFRNQSDLVNKD